MQAIKAIVRLQYSKEKEWLFCFIGKLQSMPQSKTKRVFALLV